MNFLITLIGASLAVGIGVALSHVELRGAVRSALGIILLLCVVLPLVDAVGSLSELDFKLPDYSDGSSDGFSEVTQTAFQEGIAAAVSERYDVALTAEGVSVRGFRASDMRADGITVVLPSGSIGVDYRGIRDFVEDSFTRGGSCEVVYG